MIARRALASMLVAVLLAGAGCAGGDSPQAGDDRNGSTESDERAGNDRRNNSSRKSKGAAPGKDRGPGGSKKGSGGSGAAEGEPDEANGGGTVSESGPEFATGESVVQEPRPDANQQGVVPDYAEAIEASFTGLGAELRMEMVFAADLPDRMPAANTFMVVQLGMASDRKHEGEGFYVSGTDEGWKAYAGGKSDPEEFPGEFVIEGNRMTLTLDWSYVDGPRSFDWQANSTWGQTLGAAHNYSFDPIPDEGPAPYPG